MADFFLKNNFCKFNGEVKQKFRTAIGMDEVETEFLKSYELKPFFWLHYIEDIFFIWTRGKEKVSQFLNELNNFHSNLKFTYEISSCTVNFLNLNESLRNMAIHTDLYIKPTDGHQYLHYQSSHPLHIKTSMPYSQALRVRRIWLLEKGFQMYVSQMKEWCLGRGYPKIVVNNKVGKLF